MAPARIFQLRALWLSLVVLGLGTHWCFQSVIRSNLSKSCPKSDSLCTVHSNAHGRCSFLWEVWDEWYVDQVVSYTEPLYDQIPWKWLAKRFHNWSKRKFWASRSDVPASRDLMHSLAVVRVIHQPKPVSFSYMKSRNWTQHVFPKLALAIDTVGRIVVEAGIAVDTGVSLAKHRRSALFLQNARSSYRPHRHRDKKIKAEFGAAQTATNLDVRDLNATEGKEAIKGKEKWIEREVKKAVPLWKFQHFLIDRWNWKDYKAAPWKKSNCNQMVREVFEFLEEEMSESESRWCPVCGRKQGKFFKLKCIVVRRFRASAKRSSEPGICSRRQKGCRTYGWTLFRNVSDPCDLDDGHQVTNTIRQSLWNRQRHNLGTWYGSTLDVGSEVGSAIHWAVFSLNPERGPGT